MSKPHGHQHGHSPAGQGAGGHGPAAQGPAAQGHGAHGHGDHGPRAGASAAPASASHLEHKAHGHTGLACAVITVSDTRTPETDHSGQLVRRLLEEAGHRVCAYHIIKDEPGQIRPLLQALLAGAEAQAVLINGGTGIARRDVTFDAIQGLLEKQLPGFGELFRSLSYQEIGSAALLSRALAGTAGDKVVFSTPGSTAAVRLAMEKLILPELPHIVFELHK